jgi:glycerophosphoryl diester phosphodiesterase
MLVISHRGAAGLARENTMEALRAGLDAGADMLEFDVRLTKDGIPILAHDFLALRTHNNRSIISRHTLAQLQERFQDQPIITLKQVLDEFFGVILLNIEIKGRGTGGPVAKFVKNNYITSPKTWDNVLFSSFHATELVAIRRVSQRASLGLLHSTNPYIFIAYHRLLRLTAVGFHRLYISDFAIEIAKRAGLFTYVYTVDRPHAALLFSQQNIDGVVTNRPDLILSEIAKQQDR